MTLDETRCSPCGIDIGTDDTRRVTRCEEEAHCCSTGVHGAVIVANICDACRDTRTDTSDSQKDRKILNAHLNVTNQNNIPHDNDQHSTHDKNPPFHQPIRSVCHKKGRDESKHIRRDREQVRVGIGITQLFDNRRCKECKRIKRLRNPNVPSIPSINQINIHYY